MAVIAESRLVNHRLRVLEQRRPRNQALAGSPPQTPLPAWAAQALELAGMTRAEVESAEWPTSQGGVDGEIGAAEADLLRCGAQSFEDLCGLAEAAANRLQRSVAASGSPRDPDVVRGLELVERLRFDLTRLSPVALRGVG
ncbi:MAG: hypothetical protein EA356_02580 [Geminicoccaceae bacterium]|nr:MAG: hypothetical protein EA356_02580 [Geminicoccaceae bacterium]